MEDYKEIPGYPNYGISPTGEVKNLVTGKVLKQQIGDRYLHVVLYHNKIPKTIRIHTLMGMTFLDHMPDITQKVVVDHIDKNIHNNDLNNLQLISQRENISKGKLRSKLPTGVYNYNYKNIKKYTASIYINNKATYLGMFDTVEEASQAYQQKLKEMQ
jgi:hypothetical protein